MLKAATSFVLRSFSSFSLKNPHQILGLRPTASEEQIKKAYYRLAKLHHPDMNPSSTSSKFTSIHNAYQEMLKYTDRQKSQFQSKQKSSQQQKAKPHKKAKNSNKKHENIYADQDFFDDEEDIEFEFTDAQFSQFQKAFNSFIYHGYLKPKYMHFKPYIQEIFGEYKDLHKEKEYQKIKRKEKKSDAPKKKKEKRLDLIYNLSISLDELGDEKRIKLERQIICNKCEFHSSKNYVKVGCRHCHKTGMTEDFQKCSFCNGNGHIKKYHCKSCDNLGHVLKKVDEIVIVPLGAQSGDQIIMEGRGNQHPKKGNYGDLIINIILSDDRKHSKKAQQINLSVAEAVLGFSKNIQTRMGEKRLQVPAGCQDGEILKTQNIYHIPKNQNIYVKILVKVPTKITEQEKIIYQKIRRIRMQNDNHS